MKFFVKNKRGSLSLSMEAIVILILAVVMLGLGLTFVRGIFSDAGDVTDEALGIAELDAKPTEADPVAFTPSDLEIKEGKTDNLKVGFYNAHPTYTYWVLEIVDNLGTKCGGSDPGNDPPCYGTSVEALYQDLEFTLDKDQIVGWNIIFEPQSGSTGGDATKPFLFTVRFCGSDSGGTFDCDTAGVAVYQRELFMTVRR